MLIWRTGVITEIRMHVFHTLSVFFLVYTQSGIAAAGEWEDQQAEITADILQLFRLKVEKLEKSEQRLKESISTLISTNVQLRIEMEEANAKYAELDGELREKIKELTFSVDTLKKSNVDMISKLIDLQQAGGVGEGGENVVDDVCQFENENIISNENGHKSKCGLPNRKTGIRPASAPAAFTVYLDGTGSAAVTADHVVVYTEVLLNVGNAYDTKTGVFTVPASGIYMFSWTWAHHQGIRDAEKTAWQGLVVNGDPQIGKETSGNKNGRNGSDDQSSTSVVLRLSEGDKVWTTFPAGRSDGDGNTMTASFTGVLIHPELDI